MEGIQRRDSHPRAQVFSALGQPVLVHGARPSRHQVHSSGPWDDPSREWFAMPVSSWVLSASVLVVPHASHRLWVPARLRSGRGSDAAVQARLDMGPHGVPRGCQLSSQSGNGGSLEAQLSDRPADRPRPHTRPGSTHRVVLLNESHDPAGAFAAHPAPYCSTGSAPGPRPRARRSPPPPHARDRKQSPHNPGSQHNDHRTLCRAPDRTHAERQQPDGSPPSQRADHTDHNDQATQNSSR